MLDTKQTIIPATFDPIFKTLLTSEECRDYLADIISYITKIPREDIINNIIIKNNELMKNKVYEKKKTTDLIIDILNCRINLEMNKEYYDGVFSKNNSYQHKIAAEQFLVGQNYIEEKKIIQINFDVFTTRFDERPIIKFMIIDVERNILETENYEKYHVNLDLIEKMNYNKEKLRREEKELLLLTMDNIDEINSLVKGDSTMEKVRDKIIQLSEDEELVGVYDKEIVDMKIRNSMIMTAQKEGLEQGIQQGSNQEKINIAKNLLSMKLNIQDISKATGLTIGEINNIELK